MKPTYYLSQTILKGMFVLVFRGRVFGVDNVPARGGALLVANHQSFLDPMLVGLGLRRESWYLARESLFRHFVFGRMIRHFNAFPVRRGKTDVAAIKHSLRTLKSGRLLNVFPEGTRTRNGEIGTMQPGVVMMARRARVPMVPTMVLGSFEAWPRGRRLPRPAPVIVAYASPLSVARIDALSDDQCIAIVRERITALMEQYAAHSLFRRGAKLKPRG